MESCQYAVFTDACYFAVMVRVERYKQVESENRCGRCEINSSTQAGVVTHDNPDQGKRLNQR